jgi:histone arginine demethylase JMJD6
MDLKNDQIGGIERRGDLDYAEFVECFLKAHRPVIIENALREWRAVGRWTPECFAQVYGEVEVVVEGRRTKLRELVRLALESRKERPAPYLRNFPVGDISKDLLQDIFPLPGYLSPNWLETHFYPAKMQKILGRAVIPDIFIAGAGASFPFLHYDLINSHAFLSQIYGDKHYVLYSPDQTKWLYQCAEVPNRSRVSDPMEPDLETFPLVEAAHPIRGMLRAGEMLFIPAGWWHAASALSFSITVSVSVANSSNWIGLIKEQCAAVLRSSNPLRRLAVAPLAVYLTCIGLYRSLVPSRV